MPGLLAEEGMQRDVVRLPEQLGQAHQGYATLFGGWLVHKRVSADHTQVEAPGLGGHHASDIAAAYQPQRLAPDGTHGGQGSLAVRPASLLDAVVHDDQFLGAGEQQGDGVVGDLFEAEVGDIDHQDAVVGGCLHVYRVISYAVADDRLASGQRLHDPAGYLGAHYQQGIGILGCLDDIVLGGAIALD
jgi:hypothetical protein